MMKKSYMRMKTMKKQFLLCRDQGSVLIVALVILALFTLLSISTTATTNMEVRITGNENVQKENLYAAEAAAMRCAQDMQDSDLRATSLPYLNGISSATHTQSDIISLNSETLTQLPATTAFACVSRGIASDSSLDMTKIRTHEYLVYGWCNRNKNLVIVEVGYRKAFK
jgi:Tfp pilus assembly protein PilX